MELGKYSFCLNFIVKIKMQRKMLIAAFEVNTSSIYDFVL